MAKSNIETFTGGDALANANTFLAGLDESTIVVSITPIWNVTAAQINYVIVYQA